MRPKGLPCDFCGFQCMSGLINDEWRTMYRCANCGRVLCEKCVDEVYTKAHVAKSLAALATLGVSRVVTGSSKKKICTKCGSDRIKEIHGN
jgi:hypothetical protein